MSKAALHDILPPGRKTLGRCAPCQSRALVRFHSLFLGQRCSQKHMTRYLGPGYIWARILTTENKMLIEAWSEATLRGIKELNLIFG